MGTQQFYKGDPSLKQYYLVNDFTGGINNTSVDERTADNEFRELLNVELDKKGMIQNRKGWGQLTLLNDLLSEKEIVLPYYNPEDEEPVFTNKFALIKTVRNDGNVLRLLNDYQERGVPLNEFLNTDYLYHLEILMIYEQVDGIKLGLLTLSNDTEIDAFEEIASLAGGQFNGNKPLTNIETVEYTDFLYFSLSQLQSELVGFGEYNISTKTYRIVRDDETPTAFIYKPSPYEVTKVGFNILSKNPLTDIRKQEGFLSVQGLFLTTFEIDENGQLEDTETPILNIPTDGKFTVNVIYTGNDVDLSDFTLEFLKPSTDEDGLPILIPITNTNVVVASKVDDTGVARFGCNLTFQNLNEVTIRVKLLSGLVLADITVTAANTFASTTAMVNYFNPTANTKFAVAKSSTLFDLYNKLSAKYQYELMPYYTYNSVNYDTIYNDVNITQVQKWSTSNLTAYNAATSRSTYRTSSYTEYTNMNDSNVPESASSKVDGFVLRVQKSRLVTTTSSSTTYNWTGVSESIYNNASSKSSLNVTTDGTSCTPLNNINSSNLPLSASSYSNGHVVRVTSNTFEVDGEGQIISNTIQSCGFKYFQSVHTTTTTSSTTYQDASPAEYKYFIKVTENAGTTSAILTYNAPQGKLYYRLGLTKTQIASGIVEIPTIAARTPNVTDVLLAGTAGVETNYYRYNGGVVGDLTDFTQVTFVSAADEISYTDIYPIGTNPNAKPIEQLQTKDFRLLEISSRLVIYRENVIWFSDLYQFDYIPNYNFIILPLTPDDKITNISYFKGSYMIFTKERIYKMSGTFGGQDFQIQIVNDAIGCISPYSVKPFNNTLVFMTRDGLYRIKQNYYLGGLENVEKIDKQIGNIVPGKEEVYAALHNEQYMLFYKYDTDRFGVAPFNVVKMYYNMNAPQGYPFVKDKYSVQPNIIAVFDDDLISIVDGLFYMYDVGYSDFMPSGELTTDQRSTYLYTTTVRTSNLFFYYPTHDKKFKSILVKTNCNDVVPLYFNIWVDNRLVYSSQDFVVTREGTGTLTYNAVDIASLELQPGDELDLNLTGVTVGNVGALGQLDLGADRLGDTSTQTHKIVFAAKGKNITVEVRQRLDKYFGIQDIGYVYKMGKAREDR
jgi:hypothetical protein